MVAHPIRFGATRKQPMYPSPDMARRILLHGSHPEVGKLETQIWWRVRSLPEWRPRPWRCEHCRNRIHNGLAARATSSKLSWIERCLLNSKGKHAPNTFSPVEGMSFDSCQEAYKQ